MPSSPAQRSPIEEATRLAKELSARSSEASSAIHYEELTKRVKDLAGLFRYGLYSAFGELGVDPVPAVELPPMEYGSAVSGSALSGDGRILAFSKPDTAVTAISLETKRELVSISGAVEDACKKVHLAGDSGLFHVDTRSHRCNIVRTDLSSKGWLGRWRSSTIYESSCRISDFDVSPKAMVAVGSSDLCVRLLDVSGKPARLIAGLECRDYPEHVALSGSGDMVIVAEAEFGSDSRGRVVLAALDPYGEELGEVSSKEISGRVTSIAISANGDLAAAGTEDGQLTLVSTRQGGSFDRPVFEQSMTGRISAIDFHPAGNLLAVASGKRLTVLSLDERGEDGRPLEIATFRAETPIATAHFKPDGSGLVAAEWSGKIWIF